MFGFWAFVRNDQRKIKDAAVKPQDRRNFKSGYVPGLSARWIAPAGGSMLCGVVALMHYASPKEPPFTGRWALMYSGLFELFGTYGVAHVFALGSLLFAIAALAAYKVNERQRKAQNVA
jgi:hypothetical protein